jgi:hypothetical protein
MTDEKRPLPVRIRAALLSLFNHLNAIGAFLLTYALQNQTVVAELMPFLPAPWRPYAPILGAVWWILVQIAKARAIQKATPAK